PFGLSAAALLAMRHGLIVPSAGVAIVGAVAVAGLGLTVKLASRRMARSDMALRWARDDCSASLRLLIEALTDAFVQTDEKGTICEWNARASALFGWPRADIIGRPAAGTIVSDKHFRFLAGSRHRDGLWIDIDARHRDGHALRVELAIVAQRGADGRVRFNAFERDRAVRDRADVHWRRAQRMEIISRTTGGLAYDFNNLLGIIVGNLELLQERLANRGDERRLAQESLDAALRGGDLTRRLRAFAGQLPMRPHAIDLNRMVRDVIRDLRRAVGDGIEIVLDLTPDAWPALADPAQLEASLVHLAANARDAMAGGGSLKIATRCVSVADRNRHDDDLAPGDYAVLEVCDSGPGIAPEIVDRVFEPFFTTKERGRGTGLGLSMVFGFAKQSQGHIDVESRPDAGATFRLYLPRAAEIPESAPPPVVAEPMRRRGSETVLAVEDNAAVRRVVARQLSNLGYRVLEAASAADALLMLNGEKVDLLFTDVVMPGDIGGVELARQAAHCWPALKIVLTSGYPEARANGSSSRHEIAHSFRYLGKPYRKEQLARILREALTESGNAAA
ncbi:MAG TPA: ATP-binding protein, partial [Alphaproteobacteria bacterium]|nr:ATP-binding protein [Alphaproteobacteria bacterium]